MSKNSKRTSARESEKKTSPVDFIFKTPQEYLNMFRERWPFGLIAALVVGGGLLYWESQKPEVYQTEATLLFEPRTDRVVAIENVVDTSLQAGQLNVHREWLLSRSFYDYVASFFSEEEIERIQRPYRDEADPKAQPPGVAAIIRPNLKAYIRRNTTIIGISVRHKDPETAAFIADRYARRYIDFNLDRSMTGTQSAIVFLQNQAEDLRERVESAERQVQDYRGKHNIASLDENQSIVLQRVSRLGGEIVAAEMDRISLNSQIAEVERTLENGDDLTRIGYIKQYGNLAQFLEERDDLKSARDRLELEYLRKHPKMVDNQQAQESVDARIQQNIDRAIRDLRTSHAAAVEHEKRLEEKLLQAEKESLALDGLNVNYRFLERNAETARNSFTQIVTRLNDTNIASQLENINIRVFDSAWTPGAPTEPNMTRMALQSGMAAFLLLVGLPIGIGLIDTRLKTSWEVEELGGRKAIGEIPRVRRVKAKLRPHIVADGKQEAACQGFLGIYSEVQIENMANQQRSFLITSALPREGKSFISNNLATTFAQHGKRTLLIDCDFRRPSIHGFYGLSNKEGFLKALESPETIELDPSENPLLGLHCPTENLHILASGGHDRRPSRFFDQEVFRGLLQHVRSYYDIVIIDTPPIGIFPDALLLSRFVDETFFVCRFNRASKNKLKSHIERISELEAPFGGIIVNGIPAGRRSAMYDYHGFGSYGNREYNKYYATAEK